MRSSARPTAGLGIGSPHVTGLLNFPGESGEWLLSGIYFLSPFGVCGLRQKFMAEVDLLYNPSSAL